MSNGIDIRQNEEKSIAMLAAQRQLYKNAKSFSCVVLLFSLIIPFGISVISIFVAQNQSLLIVSYIASIASMIISDVTSSCIKQNKKLAAYIQQKFDVYVYQMPWNKRLFGEEKNVDREIARYSKLILSNEQEKQRLKNWYTKPAAEKPILEGIISCQRENYSWDFELRRRVKNTAIVIASVLIILIFMIGVWNKESVLTLLGRIAFVIPIAKWLSGLVISLNEDMKRLEELEVKINSDGNNDMEDLQEIQRDLYEHRKECYTIPDFLYNWFKEKDEEREKRIAQM